MTDLRLDPNTHDLEIKDFKMSLTNNDDESVAQRLKIRLLFFKGEWFLNIDFGVPYFQEILKKHSDITVVDVIFRQQILLDPDVKQILEYESELGSDRSYSVDFKVLSKTGEEIELSLAIGV